MKLEKAALPKENRLPLDIDKSEAVGKGLESTVWRVEVKKEGAKSVVLKETREQQFATEKEMKASKEFYEYLKNFPGFGKFVPDTLYFKAQKTAGENPHAYALQHLMEGKPINKISDNELYKDPVLVQQLLEFVNGAIAILKETRRKRRSRPDFYASHSSDLQAVILSNFLFNSRYSDNIFITDKPDRNDQRVFFIDTGAQVSERKSKAAEALSRYLLSPIQELQLASWKKKLESLMANKK